MDFIGWMYDIAREQSPREDALAEMFRRSRAVGYNAVGLYLEHRLAYASAPWAAGPGCLTPEVVQRLAARGHTDGLRIIPFLNTLGHMEGFMRSEGGQWLAEGDAGFGGAQMCATRPACVAFARGLVEDALATFDDEWVHLGGDETQQLGQCPSCAERVAEVGQGGLYAEYFGPLCRYVLERGRRPCLWGDMLRQHPEALDAIPRDTVIFDWQYFGDPLESTRAFRQRGFDVVCCPSIQTYNAGWCFLAESEENIDAHAAAARAAGARGVLVTTWEQSYFTQYGTILPLIYAAGRRLSRADDWQAAITAEGGAAYARAADILGNEIPQAASFLRPGTWRQLRDNLVIRQNPFYLWQRWRGEACGAAGDAVLALCDEAEASLSGEEPLRFCILLHRAAVAWVRCAERAAGAYARDERDACVSALECGGDALKRLRPGLQQAARGGGSRADVKRLDLLVAKVERAGRRVRQLSVGATHRPAFEMLVHDAYVAGDQAGWRTGAYR